MAQPFRLASSAFDDGDLMPLRFTCKGDNVSPPLTISDVPLDTASLALIMHDPDAPVGDYVHWLVWNIPPEIDEFLEGEAPDSAIEGTNSFGDLHYDGPCPPSGTHRYIFELYALDAMLDVPEGASEEDLRAEIADHMLDETTLTGRFGGEESEAEIEDPVI